MKTTDTGGQWEVKRKLTLKGAKVSLSQPVRVAQRRDYLWFPSVTRLSDGRLLAVMSSYADVTVRAARSMTSWSDDGGLSWTPITPAGYGDCTLTLPSGDELLLPYYLYPCAGGMGAPCYICPRGKRELVEVRPGVVVTGWPRQDKSFALELGLSGFVFNGQSIRLRDGNYLATLYGYFEGTDRYSLVAAQSADGLAWRVRSIVADEHCKLAGKEGPCEAALARLKDGRILCVYRMESAVPFGQSFSRDEGRTWSEPAAMDGPFSVQPGLAVMADGALALSGGRPGLFLWLDLDGTATNWQKVDILAHHNACASEQIPQPEKTSSYTQVVALDQTHLLHIYDRIPNSWSPIPEGSAETNSVWVVRVGVEKT